MINEHPTGVLRRTTTTTTTATTTGALASSRSSPLSNALEAETRATIKRVLSDMEELAAQTPYEAGSPIPFNERRKRTMRTIWNLVKLALQAGGTLETVYECPTCGTVSHHMTGVAPGLAPEPAHETDPVTATVREH